jgi:hypothetical protein
MHFMYPLQTMCVESITLLETMFGFLKNKVYLNWHLQTFVLLSKRGKNRAPKLFKLFTELENDGTYLL